MRFFGPHLEKIHIKSCVVYQITEDIAFFFKIPEVIAFVHKCIIPIVEMIYLNI